MGQSLLTALHELTYLILKTILSQGYYYYFSFTNEKNEAQIVTFVGTVSHNA